jgi:uncharacterized protein
MPNENNENRPFDPTQGNSQSPNTGTGTQGFSGQGGENASSNQNSAEQGSDQNRSARGTAAMDPQTRQEVARKGGLAVSRNRAHMAEIGRKGGQSVSKNREHMAQIGRKGGAASRGHREDEPTGSATDGSDFESGSGNTGGTSGNA